MEKNEISIQWDDKLMTQYDKLNKLIALLNDYNTRARDYDGSGLLMNTVEVHTLKIIVNSEPINITQLALLQRRTNGAVSQVVSKLAQRGLVVKNVDKTNNKTQWIVSSDEGKRVNESHYQYDKNALLETYILLRERCTKEEIDIFYDVAEAFANLIAIKDFN